MEEQVEGKGAVITLGREVACVRVSRISLRTRVVNLVGVRSTLGERMGRIKYNFYGKH